jgi:16S rRNA (adenine1518-N6/adenine1519-N6)-dimethyltransferase
MLTQSQLKELFLEHDFSPLKRFGENYLIDSNIKDKIIGEAGVKKSDVILEIGCGFGAITVDLAASGAKVFAVEKDKKAFSIFKELVKGEYPNLKLFNHDILEFDLKSVTKSKKIKVLGNLPYYITTPIIEYLIRNRALIDSMLLLMQREVANRLLAGPGSDDRSSISCFVQYYTKPRYIRTIRRGSFYPVPDVDSSLVRFDILDKPSVSVKDEDLFFKIIRGSFNQKRKSILNSLSREEVLDIPKGELTEILKKSSVDPLSRPEDLSLQSFANLTNSI